MNGTTRMLAVLAIAAALAACTSAGIDATQGATAAATPPEATPVANVTPIAVATASPAPTAASAAPSPTVAPPAAATHSAAWIYDPAADPAADIEAALALARSDGKPVLIDFGADWCPDCVVLARMFELPSFGDYLAGVHVVRIDVGTWDHNLDVSKEYGNPILAGIPAVVLVAPDGTVLGSTADGRLASAASMTPEAVLAVLRSLGG